MLIMNLQNLKLPVHKKDYDKIEKQNNMSINVFGYQDKTPYCIYTSKQTYADLMLLWNSKNSHYFLFKACVRDFLRNFYSSLNDRPSKTTKDVFYFI